MKKIIKYLPLAFSPIIAAPMMISCIKTSKLKFSALNFLKTKILSVFNDINNFFPETNDQDIVALKNDLNSLLYDLKSERIDNNNTLEKMKQKVETRISNAIKKFSDIKGKKIEAVSLYFKKMNDFSVWILSNILNPKYNLLISEIENFLKAENKIDYNSSTEELNNNNEKLDNFIEKIKLKKIEIDLKKP